MNKPKIFIFAGLSIQESEAKKIDSDIVFLPPISRGDLKNLVKDSHRAILIADGEFSQSLAISPGEIKDALREGSLIYGCSSMGAIRAAELEIYGMIGCGPIFEWVKKSKVFRDDWLGHLYENDPYRALTLPFIEIAALLDFNESKIKKIDKNFKSFDQLNFENIKLALKQDKGKILKVSRIFSGEMPSQKKLDTIKTLKTMRKKLDEVARQNMQLSNSFHKNL
jgi:hypothetical protein